MALFVSLRVPTRDNVTDVCFETRDNGNLKRKGRFRLVTRLACLVTDTGGLQLENGIEMKT